jgi:hypothetical protein
MNTPHPQRATLARYLVALETAGFTPHEVNNGGKEYEPTPTVETMLDEATATDEAYLYFSGHGLKTWWFYLVLGLDNAEIVSDFSVKKSQPEATAAFTAAIETTSESFSA